MSFASASDCRALNPSRVARTACRMLTVVAATASARRFSDELGALNQRLAALCERVVLVVAGHPLPIKQAGA